MLRPSKFDDVIGQESVVAIIKSKLSNNSLANSILLHGPSGVGKTTLARIISKELGVVPPDLEERNCALVRSVDSIREIDETINHYGMLSKRRVLILDEIVQLSKTTQQAALKILEEPPSHVYIIACTTSLESLLDTFLSRFFRIDLNSLRDTDLREIIKRNTPEPIFADLDKDTIDNIIALSHGSARVALSTLEKILSSPKEIRDSILQESSEAHQTLAQLLIKRAKWEDIVLALNKSGTDYESIRWGILGYTSVVMTKAKEKEKLWLCGQIIKSFKYSFRDSGKAGLLDALWTVCNSK